MLSFSNFYVSTNPIIPSETIYNFRYIYEIVIRPYAKNLFISLYFIVLIMVAGYIS